tara:strand:+ start:557 stop:1126 length:570 start_codon:yes stop_codon:yes gene_type:complete
MTKSHILERKTVAILATDGFEADELKQPCEALAGAGATVKVVSLKKGTIRGWKSGEWADPVDVDLTVAEANESDFDALVLPGGVLNPDTLRQDAKAVEFVRDFFKSGKPVAAICHGPWLLVEADVVRDRSVTSYASIKTDLINAGAKWEDAEVVCDQGLVTSRQPADLPAFCAKAIEEIAEGVHKAQHA